MGSGQFSVTTPPSEIPRALPRSPENVKLDVVNKNTLRLEWSNSIASNGFVNSYIVERYTKSEKVGDTFSFFGSQQITQIDSSGLGLSGGTFAVSFGGITKDIPVVVSVLNGFDYATTSEDLAPMINRGDEISINGLTFSIPLSKKFSSTKIPLSTIYTGVDDPSATIFVRPKTAYLPHDVSAQGLRDALEQLPSVGKVDVRRETNSQYGFQWVVTFLYNMGPQPMLEIDTSFLIGANPGGLVSNILSHGVFPDNYKAIAVTDLSNTAVVDLTNLETGSEYFVRIRSKGESGESVPAQSVPQYLAPGEVPEAPHSPRLFPSTGESLRVAFEQIVEENGAAVEEFIVEVDLTPNFENPSATSIPVSYEIQRVSTTAHSTPWSPDSTFTLSLGDYHGDYISLVGIDAFVDVVKGTGAAIKVRGSTDLSFEVTRGDFIQISDQEYRVCLNNSHGVAYDSSSLPLCLVENANVLASVPFTRRRVPIFRLDTSLGRSRQPSFGDTFLKTLNNDGSSNDVTSLLKRGDFIRVGHPLLGEEFRISTDPSRTFNAQNVPLATIENPTVEASLSSVALNHSTNEVQSFTIKALEASIELTSTSSMGSGFRLLFG